MNNDDLGIAGALAFLAFAGGAALGMTGVGAIIGLVFAVGYLGLGYWLVKIGEY